VNTEEFLENYRCALRAFLLSRLRFAEDVEQVLRAVMAHTFSHREALARRDRLGVWLFHLSLEAVAAFYQDTRRGRVVRPEDLWYGEPAAVEQAFEGCVMSFLAALPCEGRDLLKAVEVDGLSQKECAARMGISYSTLKSRVQSGRKQLQVVFAASCEVIAGAPRQMPHLMPKPLRRG
jgi:RNA polymerase sigma-70 factor (ECF subfamily)